MTISQATQLEFLSVTLEGVRPPVLLLLLLFFFFIISHIVAADSSIASGSRCFVIVTPEIPLLKRWTLQDE